MKKWISLLLVIIIPLCASEYEVIPDKASLPVLTPSFAQARTLKIRLRNGLEAYLYSDPAVDKSSAGMTVMVGSWDEPESEPGLAHFLEHMLFLGTKKYPNESEYHRFISESGGFDNAFTAEDGTSFMFSINNKAFPQALDRFSSFFKEPLFNPSGVSRELNAINQEYAKNLNNDDFRELSVLKELSDPTHPFSRFNMGNLSSLSHVSQDTLKEWYKKSYSANLMRLAVISPLPLEQLRELVVASFKDVPNLNRPAGDWMRPLFHKQEAPSFVYIDPVKDVRKVTLIWDLPARFGHMNDSKPGEVICYVLGHEGKGSLLAQLKEEKLAETITCGSYRLGPSNVWLTLEIGLTDGGLKEINLVIERFFQAVARFKEKGVPQYLFDEVKQLATIRYQYQQREDAFSTIMRYATWLKDEKMETFPQQTQVIERFDPQAVQDLLGYMTPENARYDIMAPSTLSGVSLDRTERWMGVPYAIVPIPQEWLRAWSEAKPNPKIDLPIPNAFIPQHLEVAHVEQKAETSVLPNPQLIVEAEKAKIYFAADRKFLIPKIGWNFEILTPSIVQGNAEQLALGDLLVKAFNEALDANRYPALLAGLNGNIDRTNNGISISIEGYSDKAPLLLREVLIKMHAEPISEQRFKVYKDSLLREYLNLGRDSPIDLADELLRSILYLQYRTDKEKATALRKISYSQFVAFSQKLFAKVYIQGMLYGNMTEKEAKDIAETLLIAFPGEPYPVEQHYKPEVILLPQEKGPFYVEVKGPTKGNVALLTIEAEPPFSFKKRAALQIVMQDLAVPFFDDLRTKQQTGYIVYSWPEELERKLFSSFVVQSDTHAGRDLLARFELFLERYLQENSHDLTEERFEVLKLAQIDSLRQSVKNIKDMSQALNLLAFKYDGDFDWLDKRIKALQELKREEALDFAKELFGRNNRRRIALMLNGQLPEGKSFSYTRLGGISQLRKLGNYEAR